MTRAGFEPTIPAFYQANTIRAKDTAATEIGTNGLFETFS
jgi:hypothetical protein